MKLSIAEIFIMKSKAYREYIKKILRDNPIGDPKL